MNFVFVNQIHPSTPHVSGMRSWFFAVELAKLGHRVVQICEWREGFDSPFTPDSLNMYLPLHDWSEPLLLSIQAQRHSLLERIRSEHTPVLVRKAMVCCSYLKHSGMFTDFSDATYPYLQILADSFKPHAIWGLFGNTDSWLIAQQLARQSRCPWIADMKDPWEVFIPSPLRSLLAKRFQDMSACTANAVFNSDMMSRWFPGVPTVIYSGVAPSFYPVLPHPVEATSFRLSLIGSVHDVDILALFVDTLYCWLINELASDAPAFSRFELIYAGADAAIVEPVFSRLSNIVDVSIYSYLSLPKLAALCRSVTANVFIRNPNTFHHKLLELLTCARPVIAFPGETEESKQLAEACGGNLYTPATSNQLNAVFSTVCRTKPHMNHLNCHIQSFSWGSQALRLETVLINTVSVSVT